MKKFKDKLEEFILERLGFVANILFLVFIFVTFLFCVLEVRGFFEQVSGKYIGMLEERIRYHETFIPEMDEKLIPEVERVINIEKEILGEIKGKRIIWTKGYETRIRNAFEDYYLARDKLWSGAGKETEAFRY